MTSTNSTGNAPQKTDHAAAHFDDALNQFGGIDLFADTHNWVIPDNPYRRPLRPRVLKHLNFDKPMTRDQMLDYTSLAANRVLLTVYETDFVFLPETGFGAKQGDFQTFYGPQTATLGALIRPKLENYLFSFLNDEIQLSGAWTIDAFRSYAEDFISTSLKATGNPAMDAITDSADPVQAAKTFLIQLAGDFLVESSAMARNVPGGYGPLQSELFKVVIDEYGYGVHETKHSTMFEQVMKSVRLDPRPHAYWQFYLTSSLLLNNYFNYLSRSHDKFFRYLGAVLYAETTFVKTCREMADMMWRVFGNGAEVRYFLEHAHIDGHHSRMALEKLALPAIQQHGPGVIAEIVRGVEEAKLFAEMADHDFIRQVAWSDAGERFKALAATVRTNLLVSGAKVPVQKLVELRGELSVTHVHDGDELCWIESGTMKFVTGDGRFIMLHAGEGTVIQKNRLHGAIIDSDECTYHISSIKDHTKWLS
jgi:mannose-6-phosphate isomerase-like protein (cupin superfamily)